MSIKQPELLQPTKLIWRDRDLLIVSSKENILVEKLLTYTSKGMDYNFRERTMKPTFKKAYAFSKHIHPKTNQIIYQTHQGMLDMIIELFNEKNVTFEVIDDRGLVLPAPKLENMKGFRFNQEEVLTKALLKNRSGLIKAPTRYGKTVLITNTINAYPDLKILVVGPGLEVLKGTKEIIKQFSLFERDVKLICSGSRDKHESDDITICSFDSLHKLDKKSFDLVLIDEPHLAVTDGRICHFTEFTKARMIGFGATTEGRYSGNDILITGLIGPVLSETTYLECVAMGALCPIHVYMINFSYKPRGLKTHNVVYKNYMYENPKFNALVGKICNDLLPESYQTLVFIDNERQALELSPYIKDSMIAMDKRFKNKKHREEIFGDLKDDIIKRCVCSNIYSTGVTINDIRAEVNCAGGGGGILAVQKPGRLAEVKEGKEEGIMIDFLFTPESACLTSMDERLHKDSIARLNKYQEKGYLITIVNDEDTQCNFKEQLKQKTKNKK